MTRDTRMIGPDSLRVRAIAGLSAEIVSHPSEIEREWRTFEESAIGTAFQSYAWLSTWCCLDAAVSGEQPIIVVGRDANGGIGFIWPMAISTWNGMPILTWLAQNQNWYNGGLWREDVARSIRREDINALIGLLVEQHPKLRAVHLLAQPRVWCDVANPFASLPHTLSPVQTFSFPCGLGSQAHARLAGGRQHFNKKVRRLSKRGAVSFTVLSDLPQRHAAMEAFFAWKATRLSALGLANGFTSQATLAFHRALAADVGAEPALRIDAMRVGEEPVALGLSLRFRDRHYYLNNAYHDAPWLLQNSPGLLTAESIVSQAVSDGIDVFDYGPGDTPEKAGWHAQPSALFETFYPLSASGWMPTVGRRLRSQIVRRIRNTPELLTAARYVMRGLRRMQANRLAGVQ